MKTYHWWQPLLFVVIAGASFSVAYAVLSLIIHGTVRWW